MTLSIPFLVLAMLCGLLLMLVGVGLTIKRTAKPIAIGLACIAALTVAAITPPPQRGPCPRRSEAEFTACLERIHPAGTPAAEVRAYLARNGFAERPGSKPDYTVHEYDGSFLVREMNLWGIIVLVHEDGSGASDGRYSNDRYSYPNRLP